MTFNFRTHWRTTTALCIASTIALATTAYAANSGGLSNWDKRLHLNRFLKLFAEIENGKNNNNDKNHGNGVKTASPIKHVIVLIGENRGLDHTFGTYKPKGAGQTISNLLSRGIVNEDGSVGPNFAQSQQFSVAAQSSYYIGAPTASQIPLQPDQPDAAAEHQRRPAGSERDRRSVPDDCPGKRREGHRSGRSRHPDHRRHRSCRLACSTPAFPAPAA